MPADPRPRKSAQLSLRDSGFETLVVAMYPGERLTIWNDTSSGRNIKVSFGRNPPTDTLLRPNESTDIIPTASELRPVSIACAVSPREVATLFATDNLVGVSGTDGNWTIPGICPGTYDLRIWHTTAGFLAGNAITSPDVTHSMKTSILTVPRFRDSIGSITLTHPDLIQ